MQSYEIELHDRKNNEKINQWHVGSAFSLLFHVKRQIEMRKMDLFETIATIKLEGREKSFFYADLNVKRLMVI